MSEDVLFEVERRGTRDEIADYLRTVADRLAGDDSSGSGGEFSIE